MRAFRFHTWIVPLGVLLLGCLDEWPGRKPERPPLPDLLIISIDTLRADHLSSYGYERPTTPNLDALAAEGILFERAYSHSPKTAISHMSLMTGLHPEAHGVRQWTEEEGQRLSDGIPTLATILSEHGYQTAAHTAGGHMRGELGFDQGFDAFEVIPGLGGSIALAVNRITEFARDRERPFFFFLHTYFVHDPYQPEAEFRQMFADPTYSGEIISDRKELSELAGEEWADQHRVFWERVDRDDSRDLAHLIALYDAGIRDMDRRVGNLLTRLEEKGLLENMIVVLSSDHGEEFLDHGSFLHEQVYQELLHVPLIINLPGKRGERYRGRREGSVVRLIDVAPTLLDYLGLPIPGSIQGVSLLPLFDGGSSSTRPVVMSSWRTGGSQALRVEDWKLILHDGTKELYDLKRDPLEREDLSAQEPERAAALEAHLRMLTSASEAIQEGVQAGSPVKPDEETVEQLRELGYLQ